MTDRVLPSNWGITTPEQLLSNLRVAENGGDMAECADAFEWMLRSGRLVDRKAMQTIRWCRHHNAEAMDALNTDEPKCWDAEPQYRCVIVDAALGETDER